MITNRFKALFLAALMIPGLAVIGEAMPAGNYSNTVYAQTVTARSTRPSVGRRIYRGGRWVVRKTWNGTKWVSRRVWVATKWTGRKTWRGTKKVGRAVKRAVT